MPHTVLVATTLADDALTILRQAKDVVIERVAPTTEATLNAIGNAEALIVRDEFPIDATLITAGKKLKVVGRAGAGLAGIDLDSATARGVIIMNTPGTNAIAAAEYTLTLLLAL